MNSQKEYRSVFVFLILLSFLSCKNQSTKTDLHQEYYISISIENTDGFSCYLHNLIPTLTLVDSAHIVNNNVRFKGAVEFPERYLLSIDGVSGNKLVIIENDSITIKANSNDLSQSKVIGSKLNDDLVLFQQESERIFSKIDLLFPELQRARLNNDAKKLESISAQIKMIERENIDFTFDFIAKNANSYLSAMLLNDLSKRDSIDIQRISYSYNLLSKKVQRGPDGVELFSFLLLAL